MATVLSRAEARAIRSTSPSLTREGLTAGLFGALAVAAWFLVVDAIAGQPLHTPAVLGALIGGANDPEAAAAANHVRYALLYTPVHLSAFALLGLVCAALVRQADRTPSMFALLLLLFVALEVAFSGLVAILEVTGLGGLAWTQVATGNLVAAVAMGGWLLRRHRVTERWAHRYDEE
jgi:CDP-diglyceride synthetase